MYSEWNNQGPESLPSQGAPILVEGDVFPWIPEALMEDQLNENSIVVRGLEPGLTYQFRVVAVDGQFQTPSRIQDVMTYAHFPPMDQINQTTVASSGWFIGMLLAIVFLLGVCLVVCLVKRNRGGKYAVQVMSCF